jgi:outer membrane protein OmpA-like peptidoglycan-associated protein
MMLILLNREGLQAIIIFSETPQFLILHLMFLKALSLFICLLSSCFLFAQKGDYRHPSTLGVHFLAHDFTWNQNTARSFDPGIGFSYLQGTGRNLDWVGSLHASFPSQGLQSSGNGGEKSLFMGFDVAARARLLGRSAVVHPYIQANLGVYGYRREYGAYSAAATGLQFNHKDIYLLVQAQFRFPVTGDLNTHFVYSIGIAGAIGQRKGKTPLKVPPSPQPPSAPADSDGDGILDSADQCPHQPGVIRFSGCPDRDGDGLPDHNDQCPATPGPLKYKGCPVPDSDGDGINDEDDQCISTPGVARYKGCPLPDTDKDGLNDEEDSCISVPGPRANAGCPLSASIDEALNLAARNIFFNSGSAELLPSSFPSLEKVVEILKRHPHLKLSIEGHTDNSGTPDGNKTLSLNRAKAVLNYIRSKGIDQSRLLATGFGQEKPLAENLTAEGRARNRRVELKLMDSR